MADLNRERAHRQLETARGYQIARELVALADLAGRSATAVRLEDVFDRPEHRARMVALLERARRMVRES